MAIGTTFIRKTNVFRLSGADTYWNSLSKGEMSSFVVFIHVNSNISGSNRKSILYHANMSVKFIHPQSHFYVLELGCTSKVKGSRYRNRIS